MENMYGNGDDGGKFVAPDNERLLTNFKLIEFTLEWEGSEIVKVCDYIVKIRLIRIIWCYLYH